MRRTLFTVALLTTSLAMVAAPADAHNNHGHGRHHHKMARCRYGPAPTLIATPTPPCRAVPLP